MSLDWNHNGKLDAADFFITELLDEELEKKREEERVPHNGMHIVVEQQDNSDSNGLR